MKVNGTLKLDMSRRETPSMVISVPIPVMVMETVVVDGIMMG